MTYKDTELTAKEAIYGFLWLATLASFPYAIWLDAFVLQRIWEVWVSGLWESISMISFAQAIGISFVFSVITQNLSRVEIKEESKNYYKKRFVFIFSKWYLAPLVLWLYSNILAYFVL